MDWLQDAKKKAALEAVKHVEDGFIIGLGSGTTIAFAIREIGARIKRNELRIQGVPTSYQTFLMASQSGIPITTLDEQPQLDVTIDGADQVDQALNLIKGGGGALTREKVVASASKVNIIAVDETKLTRTLGVGQPLPIEVLPFALSPVSTKIREFKGIPTLREAKQKLGPVVTDNGNFILDVSFKAIVNPESLNQALKNIPGVIETGLFINLTDIVYIGGKKKVQTLKRS